jgi:hypothetical protein
LKVVNAMTTILVVVFSSLEQLILAMFLKFRTAPHRTAPNLRVRLTLNTFEERLTPDAIPVAPPAVPPEAQPQVAPPSQPPTVVQVSGRYTIPTNSIVFISRNTTSNDKQAIRDNVPPGTIIYDNIDTWDDIVKLLENSGKFTSIVLSGHGSWGGVVSDVKDGLNSRTISQAEANVISEHMKPGAEFILLGCECGNTKPKRDRTELDEKLARFLGHPVVGNSGNVGGNSGSGDWIRFYPPAK